MTVLPKDYPLAPNFTAGELGADNPAISPMALSNVRYVLAPGLQRIRNILGVPVRVTSGYRTPEHNADIGGSSTSDHPNGLGADIVPIGMSLYAAYQKLSAAGGAALGQFDQIIYYPADGHIHVGYGPRMRGEERIKLGESYPFITNELASKLTGFAADATKVARQVASSGADAVNDAIKSVTGERGSVTPDMLIVGVVLVGLVLTILL